MLLPLLFSCSKKEGCNDRTATNYDDMVVVDDGSCSYTNITFFADSTHIEGDSIVEIKIEINSTVVDSFAGMHQFGPGNCGVSNTGNFATNGEPSVSWCSTIYLFSGGLKFRSGEVNTAANLACVEVHASL